MVSFTHLSLCPRGKGPCNPLDRKLGVLDAVTKRKESLPFPGIEPRSFSP